MYFRNHFCSCIFIIIFGITYTCIACACLLWEILLENIDFGHPLNIYSHSNKWLTYRFTWIVFARILHIMFFSDIFVLKEIDCSYLTLCWGTVLPTPLFSWFPCMLWNSFQGSPLLWPTKKSSNPWIICNFFTHCSFYHPINYMHL